MICGLNRPDGGTVHVDGLDLGRERLAVLARLGVLHDELGLYPRLTVREHLKFSAELQGLRAAAANAAVTRTLQLLDLEELAERRTEGFSHGQRMKVALGRALVHSPRNLLLDEPTRGLDVFAVRRLRTILQRLRTEGVCIVMSSHALAEVTELSDHVAVIHAGRVVTAGTPAQLQASTGSEDLESAFVALTEAHNAQEAVQ
jgi:sodium transport system ATP-binding protein